MIGLQLLFTWKVCSTGVPMRAAVEDLRGESGSPKCRRHLVAPPKGNLQQASLHVAALSSDDMICMLQTLLLACPLKIEALPAHTCLQSAPAAKMGPWSPMYYGDVPYLMVATAAEGELQFHAILRTTPTDLVPVSEKTDLATPAGRAEAVIAIINLHRLLHGVKACLPSYVLPLGYVDVRHY